MEDGLCVNKPSSICLPAAPAPRPELDGQRLQGEVKEELPWRQEPLTSL